MHLETILPYVGTALVAAAIGGAWLACTPEGAVGLLRDLIGLSAPDRSETPLVIDGCDNAPRLDAWIAAALAPAWGGSCRPLLSREEARALVETAWRATSPRAVHELLERVFDEPPTAWSRGRALIVTMTAHQGGLLSRREMWSLCLRAITDIQLAYPDFESFARDYLAARRVWRRLAVDGTEDHRDPEQSRHLSNVQVARAKHWFGARYDETL